MVVKMRNEKGVPLQSNGTPSICQAPHGTTPRLFLKKGLPISRKDGMAKRRRVWLSICVFGSSQYTRFPSACLVASICVFGFHLHAWLQPMHLVSTCALGFSLRVGVQPERFHLSTWASTCVFSQRYFPASSGNGTSRNSQMACASATA